MDQKALLMFIHLSQTLHFGKTATAFHVSPSTLSRLIVRLEQEVGGDLLHRDNRNVSLTEAGVAFKHYAEQQVQLWQAFKQEFRQSMEQKPQSLSGKLHIYCSVTAAYSHLPSMLDRFRQQHPLVEIMLTTGDASVALEQLQKKAVDFVIAANPDNLPRSVHFVHLASIELAVIAPATPCKVQQQLAISKELHQPLNWSDIPIILAEHGPVRKRFDSWYRKKQQGKPNIYATVSGHEALVSMVALGCGVGIVPKVVVENSPVKERVQYLENVGEIDPFELGACCLVQAKSQPLIKAFFDTLN